MNSGLTREQILAKYPNASASFLRANSAGGATMIQRHIEQLEQGIERNARMTIAPSTDIAKLNKTERAYYEILKRECNVVWIGVQNMTFKLADDCRFTPDFCVLRGASMECVDVKGFQREDALIKIKVAARLFPWATFVIVKHTKGRWEHENVKP